jgi:hypothetical protein
MVDHLFLFSLELVHLESKVTESLFFFFDVSFKSQDVILFLLVDEGRKTLLKPLLKSVEFRRHRIKYAADLLGNIS